MGYTCFKLTSNFLPVFVCPLLLCSSKEVSPNEGLFATPKVMMKRGGGGGSGYVVIWEGRWMNLGSLKPHLPTLMGFPWGTQLTRSLFDNSHLINQWEIDIHTNVIYRLHRANMDLFSRMVGDSLLSREGQTILFVILLGYTCLIMYALDVLGDLFNVSSWLQQ